MPFTKGQSVEVNEFGTTYIGTVVAWYEDLFTGARMVGVDMFGADATDRPESDFLGYSDEGRLDVPESSVKLIG